MLFNKGTKFPIIPTITWIVLCVILSAWLVLEVVLPFFSTISWLQVILFLLGLVGLVGVILLGFKAYKSSGKDRKSHIVSAIGLAALTLVLLFAIPWVVGLFDRGPSVAQKDAEVRVTETPPSRRDTTFTRMVYAGRAEEVIVHPSKSLDYWFDTLQVKTSVKQRGPNKVQIYETLAGVDSAEVYNCLYHYQASPDCSPR